LDVNIIFQYRLTFIFLSTVKNLNSSYARIFLPQGEKYLSYDIKVNKIA